MKLQKLYRYVRQAADEYNLIEDGDKIAVAVSGGKDSLALLYALAGLKRFLCESSSWCTDFKSIRTWLYKVGSWSP